jgi:hypothetical protein
MDDSIATILACMRLPDFFAAQYQQDALPAD